MFSKIKRQVSGLRVVLSALASAAILLIAAAPAVAQSNGLGITPELNYTIQAGDQRSDTLFVNNLSTSQPLNLRIRVVDFKPQGETGAPKLLQASDQPQTPWSLKPYISLPDNVAIPAGKSKMVPFTIKIPANLGAGSYYSAVEYTAVGGSNQQRVNVAASSATLIFVTVPGNASELLSMVQFGVYENGGFRSLLTSSPQTFAYRVKNSGNVSESPSGSIAIKNMFGHIVAHIDNANPKNQLVLIGQTRRLEVCNPKNTKQSELGKDTNCTPLKLSPGHYTAEVVLLYGLNGHTSRQISAIASFWYLPLWFIVLLVIVLLIIGYAIYWLYRKTTKPRHRKHKKQTK